MRAKKIEWLIEIKGKNDHDWREMDRKPTLKEARTRVKGLLECKCWGVRLTRCRIEYKPIKEYEMPKVTSLVVG